MAREYEDVSITKKKKIVAEQIAYLFWLSFLSKGLFFLKVKSCKSFKTFCCDLLRKTSFVWLIYWYPQDFTVQKGTSHYLSKKHGYGRDRLIFRDQPHLKYFSLICRKRDARETCVYNILELIIDSSYKKNARLVKGCEKTSLLIYIRFRNV